MRRTARSGFTVLELTVVIAVIGLIIGGVIAGQSLVRGSQLTRIGTDGQQYVSSVKQFQGRFKSLPGDMMNATNYWGTASTCPNGGTEGTCNGNGNQLIERYNEMYRAWQHLGMAGVIDGQYSGLYTLVGGIGIGTLGRDMPTGPIKQTGWSITHLSSDSAQNHELGFSNGPAQQRNWVIFGGILSNSWANNGILTPADAESIDEKFDDGKPGNGTMWAQGSNCTTATTVNAAYNVRNLAGRCLLGFLIQ